MPEQTERVFKPQPGDRLIFVDDYEDEREVELRRYYPNLRSDVTPRDWDEPPWGHKEEKWPRKQERSKPQT